MSLRNYIRHQFLAYNKTFLEIRNSLLWICEAFRRDGLFRFQYSTNWTTHCFPIGFSPRYGGKCSASCQIWNSENAAKQWEWTQCKTISNKTTTNWGCPKWMRNDDEHIGHRGPSNEAIHRWQFGSSTTKWIWRGRGRIKVREGYNLFIKKYI